MNHFSRVSDCVCREKCLEKLRFKMTIYQDPTPHGWFFESWLLSTPPVRAAGGAEVLSPQFSRPCTLTVLGWQLYMPNACLHAVAPEWKRARIFSAAERWRDARDTFHFQTPTKPQVTPDEHGCLAVACICVKDALTPLQISSAHVWTWNEMRPRYSNRVY